MLTCACRQRLDQSNSDTRLEHKPVTDSHSSLLGEPRRIGFPQHGLLAVVPTELWPKEGVGEPALRRAFHAFASLLHKWGS